MLYGFHVIQSFWVDHLTLCWANRWIVRYLSGTTDEHGLANLGVARVARKITQLVGRWVWNEQRIVHTA